MSMRITFTNDHETTYPGENYWEVTDGGVLKIGTTKGKWDVIFAPHAWKYLDTDTDDQ
ncbi:hypothetical protein [Rhodococcus erythropolis]|uniref:hypothetical protein n=1 Tax=Rhodococcus erythropolis TaxID=1833 RepID=UPI00366ADE81